MIYDVIGINIWTRDLERLQIFYRDTLKLPLHSDHGDFVVFCFGGMRLNLGLHDEVEGATKDPYRIMINFGVQDIHSEHQRLVSKGVNFIRHPQKERWGGWVATFPDPDGNLLQLLDLPTG